MYSAIRTGVLFFLAIVGFSNCQFVHGQASNDSSGTGGLHSISGRIYLPNGRVLDTSVVVELQSTTHPRKTAFSDRNGAFSFTSLSPGSYTIVVDAGESFEIQTETIYIEQQAQGVIRVTAAPRYLSVPIYLQTKHKASISRAKIINAKLSSAPKAAADLYEKAQLSINKGDVAQGILDLRQAINVYNEFPLAWNDLGVLLEKSGDTKGAIEAFDLAVKFDPESFAALLNLGSALAQTNQFSEAEKYLAIALTKNGNSFRGHFYMGITQSKLGRFDIAEQAFLQAIRVGSDKTSKAHYLLAGVYWATKEYAQAANELEKYLALEPNAKDAVKTRQSIEQLRKKQK